MTREITERNGQWYIDGNQVLAYEALVALQEQNRQLLQDKQQLQSFARKVLMNAFQGETDGVYTQELAIEHGLLQRGIYDPDKHGAIVYVLPGDEIYEFSDLLEGNKEGQTSE